MYRLPSAERPSCVLFVVPRNHAAAALQQLSFVMNGFLFLNFCHNCCSNVASADLDTCADWILHKDIVADPDVLGVPVSIIAQVCIEIYF